MVSNPWHPLTPPLLRFPLSPDCWTAHSSALRHSFCPATPGAMANHVSHPQYCLGDTLATIVDHPQYRLGEYWPTCGSTSDLMGGTGSPPKITRSFWLCVRRERKTAQVESDLNFFTI